MCTSLPHSAASACALAIADEEGELVYVGVFFIDFCVSMDSDGKAVMGKEKEGLVDEDGKIRRDGLKDERTEFQKSYVYYDSITGNPRVNRKPLMQSPWVLLGE